MYPFAERLELAFCLSELGCLVFDSCIASALRCLYTSVPLSLSKRMRTGREVVISSRSLVLGLSLSTYASDIVGGALV